MIGRGRWWLSHAQQSWANLATRLL